MYVLYVYFVYKCYILQATLGFLHIKGISVI